MKKGGLLVLLLLLCVLAAAAQVPPPPPSPPTMGGSDEVADDPIDPPADVPADVELDEQFPDPDELEDFCDNGVLDEGEDDVDCGGDCLPCQELAGYDNLGEDDISKEDRTTTENNTFLMVILFSGAFISIAIIVFFVMHMTRKKAVPASPIPPITNPRMDKLKAFVKANLGKYPKDSIRDHLISNNFSPQEVDEAFDGL